MYVLSCVCVRLSSFSRFCFMESMELRVSACQTSFGNNEKICTLFYYGHEIRNKNNLSLLTARSWNNGLSCIFCVFCFYRCMINAVLWAKNRCTPQGVHAIKIAWLLHVVSNLYGASILRLYGQSCVEKESTTFNTIIWGCNAQIPMALYKFKNASIFGDIIC